jgi:predicted nucleic acid-binding protein
MAAPEKTLIDTGPIVALLVAKDAHNVWARRVWGELEPPLLTCEAVLSEAQFLVARFGGNPRAVLEFVERPSNPRAAGS